MLTALIDGDILLYRICFSIDPEASLNSVKEHCDNYILDLLNKVGCHNYIGIIGINGSANEKYSIFPDYKKGRPIEKPPHWNRVINYLVTKWKFIVIAGVETDDAIAFCASEIENPIIVSSDKDLNQVPGKHYRLGITRKGVVVKEDKIMTITKSYANYFYNLQLLMGDSVDNVKGIPGIGEVKAKTILEEVKDSPSAMTFRVMSEYKKHFGDTGMIELAINMALLTINGEYARDMGFSVPEPVHFKDDDDYVL